MPRFASLPSYSPCRSHSRLSHTTVFVCFYCILQHQAADATSVACTASTGVAITSSTTSTAVSLADRLTIKIGGSASAGQTLTFTCVGGLLANPAAGAIAFTVSSTTDTTAQAAVTGYTTLAFSGSIALASLTSPSDKYYKDTAATVLFTGTDLNDDDKVSLYIFFSHH